VYDELARRFAISKVGGPRTSRVCAVFVTEETRAQEDCTKRRGRYLCSPLTFGWDPRLSQVDSRHGDKPLKIQEAIRTKYRQLMQIVLNARDILLEPRLAKRYERAKSMRAENIAEALPTWMHTLAGVACQPAADYFKLLLPTGKCPPLYVNMLDTIVFKGTEPVAWLFTNETGIVGRSPGDELPMEARRELVKMFTGVAGQQPPPKGLTQPLEIAGSMFVPGGEGLTRQAITPKEMGTAMRGQTAGCHAVQRVAPSSTTHYHIWTHNPRFYSLGRLPPPLQQRLPQHLRARVRCGSRQAAHVCGKQHAARDRPQRLISHTSSSSPTHTLRAPDTMHESLPPTHRCAVGLEFNSALQCGGVR